MADLLDIENGWVHSSLVLSRFSDQALLVSERNKRGSCEAALAIGNDFEPRDTFRLFSQNLIARFFPVLYSPSSVLTDSLILRNR